MKNIILGLILMLVFLPRVSFGANQVPDVTNPQLKAFQVQQDAESKAFFEQQAQERGDFGKLHPDVMTKHDLRFKALLAIDMAKRSGKSTEGLETPPEEDPAFDAFTLKQRTDGQAFFQKQAQDRQNFLNSQSGTPAASGT